MNDREMLPYMATSLAVTNGSVLLPDGTQRRCDVRIESGRIAELGSDLRADSQIDAAGAMVVPGLIDLHTHGLQWQSAETGSLVEYAQCEAACGATTFFPTLFSAAADAAAQMRRHREATDDLRQVPMVGGFRLEAPYLAIASGGSARTLAPLSDATTAHLLEAGGGHIRLWDVSPELPGAPEFVHQVSRQAVVCSIAHTRATIDQARAVVEAGARLATHLFDVYYYMPERKDPDPDIYGPGLVDYLLIEDRVAVEIIGDGTHVSPLLVEKAFRCKPADKLVFVTDSNYGSGLSPGRYSLPGDWGNVSISDPNDGLRLVDRDMILAGSALSPIDSFRNVVRLFGRDIAAASHVWSRNPACLLGLNKGEIAVGLDADLIVLDEALSLRYTIAGGKVVFRAP